ncbi:MAG: UvrD-helicase domain-containing protein [Bdellovibrionales bacterium]|nr:UvrD-helicase domain-containing protein [Bdellovibrionales bacterium]
MQIPESQSLKEFVRAGAGAGKTTNLTKEVVSRAVAFHKENGRWPKTVVTTFTRKATQELRERLLAYTISEHPEAVEFLQSSSYLFITTMHGLFDIFLRRHGQVIGLASQFKIVDSFEVDNWRKRVIRDLLLAPKDDGEWLSRYEVRILFDKLRSYERLFWLGGYRVPGVTDLEHLNLSLVQAQGDALANLLARALAFDLDDRWPAFLSYLQELMELCRDSASWSEFYQPMSQILGRESKPRNSKNKPGLPSEMEEEIKAVLDNLKKWMEAEELNPKRWPAFIEEQKRFESLAKDYMQGLFKRKIKEAAIEADDLENLSLNILQKHPMAVERFGKDWDQWFIDEFQDTSPKQLQLLNPFIGDRPCYMVGDPQQSIYLFRGSRSEVFFNKQEEIVEEGGKLSYLQNNYRSQEKLLNFFNNFFPSVDASFEVMTPKVVASTSDHSVTISRCHAEDDQVEWFHVMEEMTKLLEHGSSPKDIAVLGRTNRDLDRLQKVLMRNGFPVVSHSSANFFSRREILDAMALLGVLINPWDSNNLICWMRSPWMAMQDQTLVDLIGDGKSDYWILFKNHFIDHPEYQPGQWLLKAFQEKHRWGVAWVFRKLLVSLGLFDYSQCMDSTGRREANLWKLVNWVEKVSREPQASLAKLVEQGAWARELEDLSDNSDASAPVEPDKINLMTIHASKGLQFPHVFMPFLNKSPQLTTHMAFTELEQEKLWSFRLPLGEYGKNLASPLEKIAVQRMIEREKQESLRVLYVGMTRAQQSLHLSWSGQCAKNSWGRWLEDFIRQQKDFPSLKIQEITEADECAYPFSVDNLNVPAMHKERPRFYVGPSVPSETSETKTFVDQDPLASQQRRWIGVVIHRLFESLKEHSFDQVLALSQKWLEGDQQLVEAALNFIQEQKHILQLIREGEVEWAFQMQEEGRLREGRVDLWAIDSDILWIVDYKTGSSRRIEEAFSQMQVYEKALCQFLKWDGPVKLCALFPFEQKIEIRDSKF